jgi:flagellar hook-associated protein 3 FlgL
VTATAQESVLKQAQDAQQSLSGVNLDEEAANLLRYQQAYQASADSLTLVETTLGQVSDLLQNVRTLAVQAGSGTLKDADRATLSMQLSSALSELMGAANATDAQGHYLFSGFQSLTQPFTQGPSGVQYNGDDGQRLVQVDSARQMSISASGADVFARIPSGNGEFVTTGAAGNTGSGTITPGAVINPANLTGHNYSITFSGSNYTVVDSTTSATVLAAQPYKSGASIRFDGMDIVVEGTPANGDSFNITPSSSQSVFQTLQNLITTFATKTSVPGGQAALTNGLKQGLANIDNAISTVLTQRGVVGARLKEIDSLNATGDARSVDYKSTISRLQDVDLNQAISDLSQQQLFLQAAQKSFAQVSGLTLFSYL